MPTPFLRLIKQKARLPLYGSRRAIVPCVPGERNRKRTETTLEQLVELATGVHTVNRDDSRTSVNVDKFGVRFLIDKFVSGAVIRNISLARVSRRKRTPAKPR